MMRLRIFVLLCLVFFQVQPVQANAPVPGDDQILSQLKAKGDKGNLISVRITSSKKTIVNEIENGVVVLNYYRYSLLSRRCEVKTLQVTIIKGE